MSTRILVLAALLVATPTLAQDPDPELRDGRWLPYLGCWVEEGAADGPMLCVVPESDGVAMLTVSGAEVLERRRVGDGVSHPIEAQGCTGVETAEFSSDGHRVFTAAEMECGGAERRTRGLMAMIEPDRWIAVRALVGADQSVAWATRYAPAPADRVTMAGLGDRVAAGVSRAVEAARLAASAVRVDDIIEATARTEAEAVRAWIVEQGDPLRLDAERLVQLADAGVPGSVIDVAVAVSFPDRFAVDRQPRDDRRGDYGWGYSTWGLWNPWGRYVDPFGYRYDRYRYYGYGGWGYGSYGYGPSVVVVRPADDTPRGGGRMVKGRGYVPSSGASRGSATRPSVRTAPPSGSRAAVGSTSSSGSKGKAKRRGGGG
jgi:hypothetical protein